MAKFEMASKTVEVSKESGVVAVYFKATARITVIRDAESGEPPLVVVFCHTSMDIEVRAAMASAVGTARDMYYDFRREERESAGER